MIGILAVNQHVISKVDWKKMTLEEFKQDYISKGYRFSSITKVEELSSQRKICYLTSIRFPSQEYSKVILLLEKR